MNLPEDSFREYRGEALVALVIIEGLVSSMPRFSPQAQAQLEQYVAIIWDALESGNRTRAVEFAKFTLDVVSAYVVSQAAPTCGRLERNAQVELFRLNVAP